MMKANFYFLIFAGLLILASCADDNKAADNEFTGREVAYNLFQASEFPTYGAVTFRERADKSVQVEVRLEGTEGDALHPVHLHYGDISTPDAEIAAPLNELSASTGESITVVRQLTDESPFTFDDLSRLKASIKIHLSAIGEGQNVILAGGNVGAADTKDAPNGKVDIAVCKSE